MAQLRDAATSMILSFHSFFVMMCLLAIKQALGSTTSDDDDQSTDQGQENVEKAVLQYLSTITLGEKQYNEQVPPSYVYHFHVEVHSRPLDNATARLRPWVKVMLNPIIVTSMSLKSMDFSVDLNVEVSWEDGRLQKPDPDAGIPEIIDLSQQVMVAFSMGVPFSLNLWQPSVKWANCEGHKGNLISGEFQFRDLKLDTKLQRITFREKVSMTFFCQYKLARYPFDEQRCTIELNYEQSKAYVNWITEMFLTEMNVPPGYKFLSATNSKCPDKKKTKTGSIECAEYAFKFQRLYDQHIIMVYIPSIILVFLSWISFWLDENEAPPRVAIGMTTLLALAMQFNSEQKDLPAASEVKALDIWMFACIFMVFASLVEFIIANFNYRRRRKERKRKRLNSLEAAKAVRPTNEPPEPALKIKTTQKSYFYSGDGKPSIKIDNFFKDVSPFKIIKLPRKPLIQQKEQDSLKNKMKKCCSWFVHNRIDRISRVVFPIVFLIFNIIYWSYYLS